MAIRRETSAACVDNPLVERHMILAGYQLKFRQVLSLIRRLGLLASALLSEWRDRLTVAAPIDEIRPGGQIGITEPEYRALLLQTG